MISLHIQIEKKGYIWAVTKGRELRKHFAVLDKLRGNWYSMILFQLSEWSKDMYSVYKTSCT